MRTMSILVCVVLAGGQWGCSADAAEGADENEGATVHPGSGGGGTDVGGAGATSVGGAGTDGGGAPGTGGSGGGGSGAGGAGTEEGGAPGTSGSGGDDGTAGSFASAGAAGTSGSGGVDQPSRCTDGGWTVVDVSGGGEYGVRSLEVPAAQNWVNTGLYLAAGEQATLTETGSWSVEDAGATIDHGPCVVGDLVARIGLYYKDQSLTCVHGQAVFTAPQAGILYLGALAGNDLGETYETRLNASGTKTVTVESSGATVPTVDRLDAASYDWNSVAADRVEITGEHVILTLPRATAAQDAHLLEAATARLDTIYDLHADLRGAVPQHGQCLRFFPDGTQPGYMLAGNPIRMALSLVDAGDPNRISRAGEDGVDVWGFAHEMGHDFTFVNGVWTYQENSIESWCNLFSIHALETLGIGLNSAHDSCYAGSIGSYATWDAWGGLCFLMQFQYAHGWGFYEALFRDLNGYTSAEVPYGETAWHFVHDLMESSAGVDVTPTYAAWQVPNPG